MIDSIAYKIRSIFELHCSAFDDSSDWRALSPSELALPNDAREEFANGKLQLLMQKMH